MSQTRLVRFFTALLVGAATATALFAVGRSATPAGAADAPRITAGSIPALVAPGERCSAAKDLAIDGLAKKDPELTTGVVLPAADVATPSEAWACGGYPVVMFEGVQAAYTPQDPKIRVTDFLKTLATANGGTVIKIDDSPAYVRSPEKEETTLPVVIFFLSDQSEVELIGTRGEDEGRLLEIATSMLARAESK